MAIKLSGQLSFTEIVAEFPDTPPHSMSEFYRGLGKVPSNNTNIPTSGQISFNNFYGAVNRVSLVHIIPSQQNFVFSPSSLGSSYVAGVTDVELYLKDVYIWSDNVSLPALTISSAWHPNDRVSIYMENAYIMGKGGKGGNGRNINNSTTPSVGQDGGTALSLPANRTEVPLFVGGDWAIFGGGGGGNGGWFDAYVGGGGGAGGGAGGDVFEGSTIKFAGGAGGAIGAAGSAGGGDNFNFNAGGGGGRIWPGLGGAASMSVSDGLSRGGGAGGSGAWSDTRNFNNPGRTNASGSGGGGGWGTRGDFQIVANNYQLTDWLPSYGSGGSGNNLPILPKGVALITNPDGSLGVDIDRPATGLIAQSTSNPGIGVAIAGNSVLKITRASDDVPMEYITNPLERIRGGIRYINT